MTTTEKAEAVDREYALDLLAWSRSLEEHGLTFDEWQARAMLLRDDYELAVAA